MIIHEFQSRHKMDIRYNKKYNILLNINMEFLNEDFSDSDSECEFEIDTNKQEDQIVHPQRGLWLEKCVHESVRPKGTTEASPKPFRGI